MLYTVVDPGFDFTLYFLVDYRVPDKIQKVYSKIGL